MPLDQDAVDAFVFDEDELELAPLSPTLEAEIEGPEHPTRRFETVDTDMFRSAVGIPTQNRIAAQTPITADTLRRIFEPHVLDQIRNAVRQIETESEAIPEPDLVWITLDGAIPTNEVELEEGVAELVRMGQPEAVQRRYRTLVRGTREFHPHLSGIPQQQARQARRNLEAFLDDLLFGPPDPLDLSREAEHRDAVVNEVLGIDGPRSLFTAITYDANGQYEPLPTSWVRVRSWFASVESPIPQTVEELSQAMLELAWLRHTRHQGDRYSILVRTMLRLGASDRRAAQVRELVDQIVAANQTPPSLDPADVLTQMSYDELGVHVPAPQASVPLLRWFREDPDFPRNPEELFAALSELDWLTHRREQALNYNTNVRALWSPAPQAPTAVRLLRNLVHLILDSQGEADLTEALEAVNDFRREIGSHAPAPASQASKLIGVDVPSTTALDAVLGDEWGDDAD